ncbi:nonsense-mediated mRNA decay NMD3 family protein [Striga hermonthica]|uniref:60S ribosomal export protein NMD3 n=1 Tax=Striga hermonthica TaxID=68872 RepID=A0A9N7MUK4_STRHE|nr:nonsense-mediated mRNA decay NMD3 family protein [Striga hermonthica]
MDQTLGSSFLCGQCGTHNRLNSSNLCLRCRRLIPDITAPVPKHVDLAYCHLCDSYKHPPSWTPTKLQPNELLSFLVKNLRGPAGARLVHSEFIWADDPPRRISVRVRVTFRMEGLDGVTVQACTIVYEVHEEPCWTCLLARLDQNGLSGLVHVTSQSPKTLLSLEPLLDAERLAASVERLEGRATFSFEKRADAQDLVAHLQRSALARVVRDELYVSPVEIPKTPLQAYAASVEVSPIRVGDLVCLPTRTSAHLGNLGPFVICDDVGGDSVAFLDPLDSRRGFLDTDKYWRFPFRAVMSREDLVEYVVLDVEDVFIDYGSKKYVGEVRVAPVSGWGEIEMSFDVKTHLGNDLEEGDYVLGYDLLEAGILDRYRGFDVPNVPNVVLVKKSDRVEENNPEEEEEEEDEDKIDLVEENKPEEEDEGEGEGEGKDL